ncbi:ABC transporter ATP-binding protein [Sporolactobacillus terrae]|uniref:ABC transporter ATP-binding protein n=1 Tax=Sporolactobacillus terrae TaxID=269673 RepID=A0A410DCG0_9BACL|nr:ABC transporter ATP-binding protein [Sporolactobacillus terrae]QAA23701.1 ABC transporter ATP-binding protein [Sporolactobacillus terrae]QAA26672.1 ABC transporter ATP-binding protein [Sporolactobacillus terrae]UAK18026.1 ABC transporter ATP-binding protein [Sporolactobacillus terrae]BBO00228.1 putative ABC transporter ATP-binding protein YhcH [Sporolactobacillus terrae]
MANNAAEKKPAVRLEHVSKRIGGKTIIDDLSFEIYSGEVFGFLGPNGAGKTTTIRMIVGLMRMSQGNIYIQGHSINGEFKKAIRQVGAIVENPEMYKFLTGYQNLIHYARMIPGISKDRIMEVVKLVELQDRIHEKVKRYSLGMRQRLGVAQALLHHPSVLILDEPTNGLDPQGIHDLRNYLHELSRKENVAVIVSSHLLSEMQLMCDRIGILQKGKLVGVEKVNEFIEKGAAKVRIQVDDGRLAAQAIKEKLAIETERIDETTIELPVEHEKIPVVVDTLVLSKIRIYGVAAVAKSLEDRFLEVTGGKSVE